MKRVQYILDINSPDHLRGMSGSQKNLDDSAALDLIRSGHAILIEDIPAPEPPRPPLVTDDE